MFHCKTAEAWTKIAMVSDVETGAAAYAYKIADMNLKLAEHCVQEWGKALKKIEQNREEDRCQWEMEDEVAHEEEERIRCEEEDVQEVAHHITCNEDLQPQPEMQDSRKCKRMESASDTRLDVGSSPDTGEIHCGKACSTRSNGNHGHGHRKHGSSNKPRWH